MKILTIGNFTRGWDGSICDEEHVATELEWAGHEVIRCQRDNIFDYIGADVDVTLVSQWDGYSQEHMSKVSRPIVYWAFDYQADGQEWHERLIQHADLYLSKRITDSKHPNWQWLSQDFAPRFLDRYTEKPERDIDVLFTGSYIPYATERNEILKAVDENYNLTIHSFTPDAWVEQGFKNVFGPVMDHDLTALIARAKINLSLDAVVEAGYWSDRIAQTMACGGFVMARYAPMMEARFRDKPVYFYGLEDCLDKLDIYLNRDVSEMQRKMLGSQGYTFAHDNLMAQHRVRDLLTIVENYLESCNI